MTDRPIDGGGQSTWARLRRGRRGEAQGRRGLPQPAAMDVRARLDGLMRLSFAEIGALPDSSSLGAVDDDGKKHQLVTGREPLGPDMLRVVVSLHRQNGLGFSSLRGALGFTINATGKIELLDPREVEKLLL